MASCGDQGCNCLVRAGAGLVVTGAGTAASPYVVGLAEEGLGTFGVTDTPTVNLSLLGSGTPTDPYSLSATSTMALTQLSDVNDPQGGPNVGDVPVWVTTGSAPHWEFQPPPANPPGAVNVGAGMQGDGTVGAPLRPRLIGTSAGGTTSGLEVYVDSVGNLRSVAPVATAVTWTSITGKPTSFPTTPADFSGILPVAKGGTGQTDLNNVTVGNATLVEGRRIYTQSGTPTGTIALNSLWFW